MASIASPFLWTAPAAGTGTGSVDPSQIQAACAVALAAVGLIAAGSPGAALPISATDARTRAAQTQADAATRAHLAP